MIFVIFGEFKCGVVNFKNLDAIIELLFLQYQFLDIMINLNRIIYLKIRPQIESIYCQNNKRNTNKKLFSTPMPFYSFSKKQQQKKRTQPPKEKPKNPGDYLSGPQSHKRNILEVKNMQTTSETQLEEQTIKKIVISQRQLLQSSLKDQVQKEGQVQPKEALKDIKFSKLLIGTQAEDQAGKYYLLRPLKYLQSFYMAIFGANLLGYTWLELTQSFGNLGWFFGMITFPSACSTIPLLIGYNLGFWIVRQSFYLDLAPKAILNTEINLVSTSWKGIVQLAFISSQFAAFIYILSFPLAVPLYKAYTVIAALNSISLFLNILSVSRAASLSVRAFINAYAKTISTISIMIFLFAFYEIQITAGKTPEQSFDSIRYRERIVEMKQGYQEFRSVFKKKKMVMKDQQRININQE